MPYRQLQPRELVFREGDMGDVAYIIESGRVEILKHADHGEVPLAILDSGEILGETALIEPGSPRSATARAIEPVKLQVISPDDFQVLFGECPPALIAIMKKLMLRLRQQNARVAARERATVLLDAEINQVTVQPGSDAMIGKFEPITVSIANFPFSIGGYASGERPGPHQLNLECFEQPMIISPHHANLEQGDDGIYFVDQGSRFGTLVNNQPIGRGKPAFKAPIVPGENRILLGGPHSPYALLLMAS